MKIGDGYFVRDSVVAVLGYGTTEMRVRLHDGTTIVVHGKIEDWVQESEEVDGPAKDDDRVPRAKYDELNGAYERLCQRYSNLRKENDDLLKITSEYARAMAAVNTVLESVKGQISAIADLDPNRVMATPA